jgi:hypothetical protein
MKYDIYHRTRYDYASSVRDSFNDVRLQPMPIPEQTVESFLLKVLPRIFIPTGSIILKSPNRTATW